MNEPSLCKRNTIARLGISRRANDDELLRVANRWHPLADERIGTSDHPDLVPAILHPRFSRVALKKYRARLCFSALLVAWLTILLWLDLPAPKAGGDIILYWLSVLFPLIIFAPSFVNHMIDDRAVAASGRYYSLLIDSTYYRTGRATSIALVCLFLLCFFVWKIYFSEIADSLIDKLGGVFSRIEQGQYWRLLTATVVHVSMWHLGSNSLLLLVVFPLVFVHARWWLLVIAIISSVCGNIAEWKLGGGEYDAVIGASGVVMSILGAWLAFAIKDKRYAVPLSVIWNIFSLTLVSALPMVFWDGRVAVLAHLSSMALGFVMALIYCGLRSGSCSAIGGGLSRDS
jgi:membrane associated rhomboid family serine protease